MDRVLLSVDPLEEGETSRDRADLLPNPVEMQMDRPFEMDRHRRRALKERCPARLLLLFEREIRRMLEH